MSFSSCTGQGKSMMNGGNDSESFTSVRSCCLLYCDNALVSGHEISSLSNQ